MVKDKLTVCGGVDFLRLILDPGAVRRGGLAARLLRHPHPRPPGTLAPQLGRCYHLGGDNLPDLSANYRLGGDRTVRAPASSLQPPSRNRGTVA